MVSKFAISVVINTLNEQANIASAIRTVAPWADEVLVVDMHSDDNTREIAESLGVRVFLHERLGFVSNARQVGIDLARNEWILILDADESVPRALADKIIGAVRSTSADVFRVPRTNYLFGKRFFHGDFAANWDYQLRLFRRHKIITQSVVHEELVAAPDAVVADISPSDGAYLHHFNYVQVEDFVGKLNRYTTLELERPDHKGRQTSPSRAMRRLVRSFYKSYFRRRGYRDGVPGFYVCMLQAFYVFIIEAKLDLRNRGCDRSNVLTNYDVMRNEIISQYEAI